MNEPSSRTPEGVPHRCEICGTLFQLNTSVTGDFCCPNCNALAWPVGDDPVAPLAVKRGVSRSHGIEIRLRPRTIDAEFDEKSKRAAVSLRQHKKVMVSVLFGKRSPKHQEEGKAILERFVDSLVPQHAKIENPSHIDGRRIVCMLAPASSQDGG